VADGVDGFLHQPSDPAYLAAVIVLVFGASADERDRIRRAGARRVLTSEAWPRKIVESLRALVPAIDRVAGYATVVGFVSFLTQRGCSG
jgi:hypothetical protein